MDLIDFQFSGATLNQIQEETGIPWSELVAQLRWYMANGLIEAKQKTFKGIDYPVFTNQAAEMAGGIHA